MGSFAPIMPFSVVNFCKNSVVQDAGNYFLLSFSDVDIQCRETLSDHSIANFFTLYKISTIFLHLYESVAGGVNSRLHWNNNMALWHIYSSPNLKTFSLVVSLPLSLISNFHGLEVTHSQYKPTLKKFIFRLKFSWVEMSFRKAICILQKLMVS